MKPTYYEFFAGGGMARAGLGDGWRCLFANDIEQKKGASYIANWGASEFCLGDIHHLKDTDLPGEADLAWASFPCQDLSLAGNGHGLDGEHSGAFWGFYDVMHALKLRKRAPKMLVLENVGGAVTSNHGRDFSELCKSIKSLGYVYGALMLDAVHFVPQSRPRLFIVCLRSDLDRNAEGFVADSPSDWTTTSIRECYQKLRPDLRQFWRWWRLPPPSQRNEDLSNLLLDEPTDVPWHSAAETSRLVGMMSPVNLMKVKAAKSSGQKVVGTIYKRTRLDEAGKKIQRAEVRFDGVSGCLRTPRGGSSRQTVIVIEGRKVRTRLMSAREAARLMGLDDSYILPPKYNDAYHLVGDGLAVPVVKFLADHLLRPLLTTQTQMLVAAE